MADFDLGISKTFVLPTDYKKDSNVQTENVSDKNSVTEDSVREDLIHEEFIYLDNKVDLKNVSESQATEGSFDLGFDEVDKTNKLDELKPIDNKALINQSKENLSTYVLLLLQASMKTDGKDKKAIVEKAKELLKEYVSQKEANPSISKELESVEKLIFKTNKSNKILVGEIDSKKVESFLGIKQQSGLARQANSKLEESNKIDKKIKDISAKPQSLLNNLEIQKLEAQKSLLLIQSEIDKNLALGISPKDSKITNLINMRTEIRQTETKTLLSIELNKLQDGANPIEIQKNIQKIGDTWYVKNNSESQTQYRFALAQAKVKGGDFDTATKLYEEIKNINPDQALTAQISIVSAKAKSGLFTNLPLYETKLGEILNKQKEYNEIGNKNSDKAVKLLIEINQIKRQFGTPEQLQVKVNTLKAEQNKLINDIDSSYRKNFESLRNLLINLQKEGNANTPEYNALKEEFDSLEDKRNLAKASIYEKQGDSLSAIKQYEKVVLNSKTIGNEYKGELLLKISANYVANNDYDKAIESAETAKKFTNKNITDGKPEIIARANMLEASALLQRDSEKSIDLFDGDTKKAIELYKQTINSLSNVNTADAKFLLASNQLELAKVYYSKGDFKEGNELTNHLASTNKDFKDASLFLQGSSYLQKNKSVDAFKVFDKILKDSPNSPQAQSIKKELSSFMTNGRLDVDKIKGKGDLLAAAQVALDVSGSNHVLVSVGLATGGAAAGAAIGACFFGVGAIPGALVGLAVGTAIDRVSGIIQGSDEISQAYSTGYENISSLQNTMNLVGLGLDLLDIIPVVGALGKVGAVAMKQTIKAGLKTGVEVSGDALENVVKKSTKETVGKIEKKVVQDTFDSKQLSKMFFEDTDKFAKVFTNSKFAKAQLAVGGTMIMTPGTIQVANAINEYSKGNIDSKELQNQLLSAGGTTVKSLASIVALGLVMGKVQDMTLGLDKITKGISVEMSGTTLTPHVDVPNKTSVENVDLKLKKIQTELNRKGSEAFTRDLILNANEETFNNLKMFAKDALKDMDYATFVKTRTNPSFQTPIRQNLAKFLETIKESPETLNKVLKTLTNSPTLNKVNELLKNVDRKVIDNIREKYPELKTMTIEKLHNKINTDAQFRQNLADDIAKSLLSSRPKLTLDDITRNAPIEKTKLTKSMIDNPPKTADEMKNYIIQTLEDMMKLDNSAYSAPRIKELQNILTLIKDGKIEINMDTNMSRFAQVHPAKDSKYISINFNPNEFNPKFTDEAYIAHEIIHIATPMSGVSDGIREAFTEYTARKLFPRDDVIGLNYDKMVNGLDKMFDNILAKADTSSLMKLERLFNENLSSMTPAEFINKIKTDPSFKEDVKLRFAEFLMGSKNNDDLEVRLTSYFRMDFRTIDVNRQLERYFREAE